jgi:hypothetical protein
MSVSYNKDEFPAGSWVNVEVYGLPDGKPKRFTYRTTYSVRAGETVHVPAPEWVTRATRKVDLPGCVIGEGDANLAPLGIKDIIPVPAMPKVPDVSKLRDLVVAWRKEAAALEAESFDIRERADALENALYGEEAPF